MKSSGRCDKISEEFFERERKNGVKEKRIGKNDVILIMVVLLLAMICLLGIKCGQKEGTYIVVCVDGEEVASYSMDINQNLQIIGVNGGTNELVIEDGEAYLLDASCPDLLCVHQGRIKYQGETIVCLPNRVVIKVIGGEEAEVDTVVR